MNAMPAVSAAATDLVDGHYEDTTLTRLAFGSCNKQVASSPACIIDVDKNIFSSVKTY